MRSRRVWWVATPLVAGVMAALCHYGLRSQPAEAPDTQRSAADTELLTGSFVVAASSPSVDLAVVAARHELAVVRSLPALDAAVLEGPADAETLDALRADSDLRASSPNLWFEVAASCCEGDSIDDPHTAFANAQRKLDANFGPLRLRARGLETTVVAVLDTGIDASHRDLGPGLVSGLSLIEGASASEDTNGHGTAMASLVGARCAETGHGLEGVAPGVRLLPVRVANGRGRSTLARVAEGIVYAVDRGADVVLLSLGARRPSAILSDAISYAEDRGVLLVAAAGNRTTHADLHPAADPRVLSVGCVEDDGQLALSTTFAPTTDLLAPGVDAAAALPMGTYGLVSGSSASAARIAGVAALVRGLRPELSPGAVRELLRGAVHAPQLFAGDADLQRAFPAGVFDAQRLLELLDRQTPRVELADPRVLPAQAEPGDPVLYRVRATNHGLETTPASTLRVVAGGELLATIAAPALSPGESVLLETHAPAKPGQIAFELGGDRQVTELTRGPLLRDLALANLVAEARPDGGLVLRATVEGRGLPTAGQLAGRVGNFPLLPQAFGPLAAGERAELSFTVEPSTLQFLPELFVAELSLQGQPDANPSNDLAALDLEVPGVGPRSVSTQYQQNSKLNLICDAPFRLAPARTYLPLMVSVAEKGNLDPSTVVQLERVRVWTRQQPDRAAGRGTKIYDDERGGPTTAPQGFSAVDEEGQLVVDANGQPDVRMFAHADITLPGEHRILRIPRDAFGVAPVPAQDEVRYLDVELRYDNRRRFFGTSVSLRSGEIKWVLKVEFGAAPRPQLPGGGQYYDAHHHTIAEWYYEDGFNILAPKRQLGGPIVMLKEVAYAIGLTDAVDAVDGKVVITDHNATYNQGDTIRDRPPLGPTSVASSGPGVDEYHRHRQIFGIAAGEEITIHSMGPRQIFGITVQAPGGVHLLSYRGEHIEGAFHGGSDLFRALGDPWPDTKLEDVLSTLATTNRAENHHSATFAAHPYGDNDWDHDTFQMAFEMDPAKRVDLPVNAEGTGFVTKGVQLWNSDGKRRKMDDQNVDFNDVNPFADPRWSRPKPDWDEKLYNALGKYHLEQVEPLLEYELSSRPGIRFPRKVLAVAGNDAHGDFNYETSRKATIINLQNSYSVTTRAYGRVVTYAMGHDQEAATPTERAFEAMLDGNSILTDGPLAWFAIDAEDRFDGDARAWHDAAPAYEDRDGRLGGGGNFDGRGTALVRRGSSNLRFGYRYTNTPEFGGDVESLALYRTSVGDPNPLGAKPSGSPFLEPRGALAAAGADQDLEEPIDPSEEGTISSTSCLQLGSFTAPAPVDTDTDDRRSFSNPIYVVPFEANATVDRTETDANGNGSIPAGALTVRFDFDMSLTPDAYRVAIKALDTAGNSLDKTRGPIDLLAPLTSSSTHGWSANGSIENAHLELTNTRPIPLNLDRYPTPHRVTFVTYFVDAPKDPFGNALNKVAFTFDAQGIGTGGGTGPAIAALTSGSGTTAPGATPAPAPPPSSGRRSSGGCTLSPAPTSGAGALLALLALAGLTTVRRAQARRTQPGRG